MKNALNATANFHFAISFVWFLLAIIIFWAIRDLPTDIQAHNRVALALFEEANDFPPNFLYFSLLASLAYVINGGSNMMTASIILLALAVAAKVHITISILITRLPGISLWWILASVTALTIMFSFPIAKVLGYSDYYYLGHFTPNVWHNSTTIFLLPFALSTFVLQANMIETGKTDSAFALTITILLGIAVKPSFFFAYAPATTLWILLYRDRLDSLVRAFMPILWGGVAIIILYIAIYKLQQGSLQRESSDVIFSPFYAWLLRHPLEMFVFVFVSGFAAPIFFLIFALRPEVAGIFSYTLLLNAFAVLVAVTVAETGPRSSHGNFFWQIVPCSYILHTYLLADVLIKWRSGERSLGVYSVILVYMAMIVSGFLYLGRMIVSSNPAYL